MTDTHMEFAALTETKYQKVLLKDAKEFADYFSLVPTNFKFKAADISDTEAEIFIKNLCSKYDEDYADRLADECRAQIFDNIVCRFGIGKILYLFDKDGGNVDTLHNVRKGIWATEKEKLQYENRGEYDTYKYHSHPDYIKNNRQSSKLKHEGMLQDGYTGATINAESSYDLDHIISAKEIHDDPARVLAEKNGPDLANKDSNLTPTIPSINRSKGQKSVHDFNELLEREGGARRQAIEALENKDSLTPQEDKKLTKLRALDSVNNENIDKKDKKARSEYEAELANYYVSGKFCGSVIKTGAVEAGKMGIQQALGVILFEFFDMSIVEVRDIVKNGLKERDESLCSSIMLRLKRIASKLSLKWKEFLSVFLDGSASGFLSNLLTTIINIFVTTSRRLVRLIREGFFSLLRAGKLVITAPNGCDRLDAIDAAAKIVVSSLIASAGFFAEEGLQSLLMTVPVLGQVASLITPAILGAGSAFISIIAVYCIDKLDFFGLQSIKRSEYVAHCLHVRNKKFDDSIETRGSELISYDSVDDYIAELDCADLGAKDMLNMWDGHFKEKG